MRAATATALLLMAAFCGYGFLASGEPGPNHIYFRIGYAVVGVACAAAALSLLRRGGP
jgi:hypothetical protein